MNFAQLHLRLQGNGGLEGYRLQVDDFELRIQKGADFLFPQDLVQGFGKHKFQGFLHQSGAAQVSLHYGAGGLAGAEAGDPDAAGQPAVGAVQERLLVRRIHIYV